MCRVPAGVTDPCVPSRGEGSLSPSALNSHIEATAGDKQASKAAPCGSWGSSTQASSEVDISATGSMGRISQSSVQSDQGLADAVDSILHGVFVSHLCSPSHSTHSSVEGCTPQRKDSAAEHLVGGVGTEGVLRNSTSFPETDSNVEAVSGHGLDAEGLRSDKFLSCDGVLASWMCHVNLVVS